MEMEWFDCSFLLGLGFWPWMSVAFVLLVLEVFTTHSLALWLAVVAGAIGTITLFHPIPVGWDWAGFGVALVIALLVQWYQALHRPQAPQQDGLYYVGMHVVLSEPIRNHQGRMCLDGLWWRISGPADTPVGTTVRITALKGATLVVERV